MKTRMIYSCTALLAACLLCASTSLGQSRDDNVDQAARVAEILDQRVRSIDIAQKPIADALRELGRQTDLTFEVTDDVYEYMPYGRRTDISIVIKNMPLRRGLREILRGIGLEMELEGRRVMIKPSDAMERIGRRLTLAEMKALGRLGRDKLSDVTTGDDALAMEFRIDPLDNPRQRFEAAVRQSDADAALEQLDTAAEALGWTWVISDQRIVMRTRLDDVKRRLDLPIDVNYQQIGLDELIINLGDEVGVTIFFEPGSLASVNAVERKVDAVLNDTSVRQIMERLSGNTGLRFEPTSEGVRVTAPSGMHSLASGGTGPTASSIYQWIRVGVPLVDGVTAEVFLPIDELPADLRSQIEAKLANVLPDLKLGD